MSSHLVDGVALPDAVAGHPALDFCNTRAGWGSATPKEYLVSWRALVLWTVDARLIAADDAGRLLAVPSAPAAREVARALLVRDAVYRAALGEATGEHWALLAREMVAARSRSTLLPGPDGPAVWTARTGASTGPVDAVVQHAEELLTSVIAGAVSACPGAGCGWLFADPRRRRRWCSMAVCGNRAKARRHAAARRA